MSQVRSSWPETILDSRKFQYFCTNSCPPRTVIDFSIMAPMGNMLANKGLNNKYKTCWLTVGLQTKHADKSQNKSYEVIPDDREDASFLARANGLINHVNRVRLELHTHKLNEIEASKRVTLRVCIILWRALREPATKREWRQLAVLT